MAWSIEASSAIVIPARLGLDRRGDDEMRRHPAHRRRSQPLFSGVEHSDGLRRPGAELPARVETALRLDQHLTPKLSIDFRKEGTPPADQVLHDVVTRGALPRVARERQLNPAGVDLRLDRLDRGPTEFRQDKVSDQPVAAALGRAFEVDAESNLSGVPVDDVDVPLHALYVVAVAEAGTLPLPERLAAALDLQPPRPRHEQGEVDLVAFLDDVTLGPAARRGAPGLHDRRGDDDWDFLDVGQLRQHLAGASEGVVSRQVE